MPAGGSRRRRRGVRRPRAGYRRRRAVAYRRDPTSGPRAARIAARVRELLGHLGPREVLAREADRLADERRVVEDRRAAQPDVAARDAGQSAVLRDGEDQAVAPVGALLRTHPEVDEIVPVERRPDARRRDAGLGELFVARALAVPVRHLVFRALVVDVRNRRPGRDPRRRGAFLSRGANPGRARAVPAARGAEPGRNSGGGSRAVDRRVAHLPRVLERRPDDVPHAGGLGRGGDGRALRGFFRGRKMLPEVRDQEDAVPARRRARAGLAPPASRRTIESGRRPSDVFPPGGGARPRPRPRGTPRRPGPP